MATDGHDRISTCLKRDVVAWQSFLLDLGLAHSTVNNHFYMPIGAMDPISINGHLALIIMYAGLLWLRRFFLFFPIPHYSFTSATY